MDINAGKIIIGDEIFHPDYSFDDFKKSNLYNNPEPTEAIHFNNSYTVFNHKFKVSLIFIGCTLRIISLLCVEPSIPFEREKERVEFHNQILNEIGLSPKNTFWWGSIESIFDSKGNVSNILICYKQRKNI